MLPRASRLNWARLPKSTLECGDSRLVVCMTPSCNRTSLYSTFLGIGWRRCTERRLLRYFATHLNATPQLYPQKKEKRPAKGWEGNLASSNFGAVLVQNPEHASQDEIISKIPASDVRLGPLNTAVILLSKGFSTWLLPDASFLQKIVNKIFNHVNNRDLHADIQVNVVAAVVDRVPAPTSPNKQNPQGEIGFEGLAFCSGLGNHALQYLGAELDPLPADHALDPERPATISFSSPRCSKDVGEDESSTSRYTIQLPLAKTVFHTGQRSTLFASTWLQRTTSTVFHEASRQTLTDVLVCLPFLQRSQQMAATLPAESQGRTTIQVPLVQLTRVLTVKASMGNIIRQLDQPGEISVGVPASQGLEEAVEGFFKDMDIPPRPVQIWALVIPKSLGIHKSEFRKYISGDRIGDGIKTFQNSHGSFSDPFIHEAISGGARLIRVISGGGGWGKKAGLLSLDPESSYSKDNHTRLLLRQDPIAEAKPHHLLREIAPPGDYISFYINPYGPSGDTDTSMGLSQTTERRCSVDFGTVPTTIDTVASPSVGSNGAKTGVEPQYFDRHFGALSEGGMSFEQTMWTNAEANAKVEGSVHKTKIDVPFSRFTYLALEEGLDGNEKL